MLGLEAAWAGCTCGEDWLSGLLAVIRDNYEYEAGAERPRAQNHRLPVGGNLSGPAGSAAVHGQERGQVLHSEGLLN